jgi:glycerol-3-phosphate cytidylyltransferase
LDSGISATIDALYQPKLTQYHYWPLTEQAIMKRVITFGTFDVFHVGHVRILERAAALGDYLIVGVSSDQLNHSKKGRFPIYSEQDRMEIISSLSCVSEVFVEESLEKKGQYIQQNNADVLVMGDDWLGKFDQFKSLCKVTYMPRTPSISTTEIIEVVRTTANH